MTGSLPPSSARKGWACFALCRSVGFVAPRVTSAVLSPGFPSSFKKGLSSSSDHQHGSVFFGIQDAPCSLQGASLVATQLLPARGTFSLWSAHQRYHPLQSRWLDGGRCKSGTSQYAQTQPMWSILPDSGFNCCVASSTLAGFSESHCCGL